MQRLTKKISKNIYEVKSKDIDYELECSSIGLELKGQINAYDDILSLIESMR